MVQFLIEHGEKMCPVEEREQCYPHILNRALDNISSTKARLVRHLNSTSFACDNNYEALNLIRLQLIFRSFRGSHAVIRCWNLPIHGYVDEQFHEHKPKLLHQDQDQNVGIHVRSWTTDEA